jgi:hypothetical protein
MYFRKGLMSSPACSAISGSMMTSIPASRSDAIPFPEPPDLVQHGDIHARNPGSDDGLGAGGVLP